MVLQISHVEFYDFRKFLPSDGEMCYPQLNKTANTGGSPQGLRNEEPIECRCCFAEVSLSKQFVKGYCPYFSAIGEPLSMTNTSKSVTQNARSGYLVLT